MTLSLQQNDTPLINVNAADSCGSSSGYDVKRHTDDDGKLSTGSAFDPTMTIHRTSQDEALFQQVARPLPMTQLQTNFITKTMLEIRKSYAANSSSSSSNSNIGHHKRQKTETMANNNNKNSNRYNNTDDFDTGDNNNYEDEDESLYSHEEYYGGSTSSSDDDDHEEDDDDDLVSLSSLALPRPSSFDIMNELQTHHKTIQFVATAGGLITHCK
jgi:hypothetical protein